MGCGRSGRSGWASSSLWLVLCLLLALPPRPAGAGQGEIRRAELAPGPVPVILVPGLDGRADTWGRSPEPGRRGTGLLGYLAGEGYQEGRDLFTFDYSRVEEPDLVRLAARELAWRVAQVRERTGAERVDLVGYGYGGLICRYYLRLPGAQDEVRTLVMIATPNQGAFSAHLLRVAAEQARQEPWPAVPSAGGVTPDLPRFTGAAAYVDERAVAYGHLYRDYLAENELLRGPGGAGSAPDFPGWLATARPELYRAWFLEGQVPPLEAAGSPDTPPRDGEALTRSYYEFLAMETGRYNYLKAANRRTVTLAPPPATILRSPDLRGALLEYLKTVVLDYVYQKGKAYLEENQTRLALQVLGWVSPIPTGGVAVERLVPERIRYPAGPDPVGRPTYHGLAANHFLLGWNGEEAPRGTRYVVIAGRTLNLAGRLWRGVTDNDLVVELESTLVPLGEDDRLIVLAGVWRGTHLAFLHDARVHRAVADALAIPRPISQWLSLPGRPQTWTRHGRGTADAWRPTYLGLTGPDGGDGRLRVTVTAEQERAAAGGGLAYHLWAHALAPDGSVTATWQGVFSRQGPVPQAVLDLPAPGPHPLLVGVRLMPVAGPGEVYLAGEEDDLAGPCRDPWASALVGAGGKPLAFSYQVTWEPGVAAAGEPAASASPGEPSPGTSPAAPAPPPGDSLSSTAPEPAGAPSPSAPPGPASAAAPSPSPAPTAPPSASTSPPAAAPSPAPTAPVPDPAPAPAPASTPPGASLPAPASPGGSSTSDPPPGSSGPLPVPSATQGLREVSGRTPVPLLIEVKTVRKLMTLKKESRTYHVRWEWELGDGRRVVEEEPGRLVSTLTPTYDLPGTYVVRAFSFSNQGQILREQRWTVTIAPGASAGPTLRAETLAEPRVVVAIEGPATWVVGRPARFTVRAWTEDPRHGKITEVKADPGWAFDVVWESPGTYAVAAAVSVKVNYSLGGRSLTVTNIHLRGVKVDVGVAAVSR